MHITLHATYNVIMQQRKQLYVGKGSNLTFTSFLLNRATSPIKFMRNYHSFQLLWMSIFFWHGPSIVYESVRSFLALSMAINRLKVPTFVGKNWHTCNIFLVNYLYILFINPLLHTDVILTPAFADDFWKHYNKRWNCSRRAISPFIAIFSTLCQNVTSSFPDVSTCSSPDCKVDNICNTIWSNGLGLTPFIHICGRRINASEAEDLEPQPFPSYDNSAADDFENILSKNRISLYLNG